MHEKVYSFIILEFKYDINFAFSLTKAIQLKHKRQNINIFVLMHILHS